MLACWDRLNRGDKNRSQKRLNFGSGCGVAEHAGQMAIRCIPYKIKRNTKHKLSQINAKVTEDKNEGF